jgi:hypothetical protein
MILAIDRSIDLAGPTDEVQYREHLAMVDRLDHLAFSVADIATTVAAMTELGFEAGVRGTCRWDEHGMARSAQCLSVVLERQYLDFIESAGGPRALRDRSGLDLYARGIVPSGVILSADSLDGALRHARSQGLEPHAPYEIERKAADGPMNLRYRFFALPRAVVVLPIGIIENLDLEGFSARQPAAHPNGANRVVGLHFRARERDFAVGQLRRLFAGPDSDDPNAATVALGGLALHVHADLVSTWLADIEPVLPPGAPVALAAIEFEVPDLATTQAVLRASDVRWQMFGARMLVDPRGGYGCGIAFRASARC